LAGAAALCVILASHPRAALLVALAAVAIAAVFLLIGIGPILVHPQDLGPRTFNWPMPLGTASLALDGLSAWFVATIAILSLAVAIYTWAYMQAEIGEGSLPAFGVFLCLLVAILVLVVPAAAAALFL